VSIREALAPPSDSFATFRANIDRQVALVEKLGGAHVHEAILAIALHGTPPKRGEAARAWCVFKGQPVVATIAGDAPFVASFAANKKPPLVTTDDLVELGRLARESKERAAAAAREADDAARRAEAAAREADPRTMSLARIAIRTPSMRR